MAPSHGPQRPSRSALVSQQPARKIFNPADRCTACWSAPPRAPRRRRRRASARGSALRWSHPWRLQRQPAQWQGLRPQHLTRSLQQPPQRRRRRPPRAAGGNASTCPATPSPRRHQPALSLALTQSLRCRLARSQRPLRSRPRGQWPCEARRRPRQWLRRRRCGRRPNRHSG